MKAFRIVGIISIFLLIISAYLPWIYISSGGVHKFTLTGMNTVKTGYKPALVAIIFSILYLCTTFIYKMWAKIAGVIFGVVVLAWTMKSFVSLMDAQNYLFKDFLQYSSQRGIGLYLALIAAIGVLVAALVPYMPDKYRKD